MGLGLFSAPWVNTAMWNAIARFAQFETDRLLLRPLSYQDADEFHSLLADPENVAFILACQSDYELALTLLVQDWLKAPLGKWALIDKETGHLCGLLRLENLRISKREAELGYLLRKDYRGQGLMTEALESFLYLAFCQFGLVTLSLIIHLENSASQAVAQRLGFQLKRRFKGSDRVSHQMRTYLEFQMNKTEYRIEREGKEG